MSKYMLVGKERVEREEVKYKRIMDKGKLNAGPETELSQRRNESFLSTISRAGVIHENTPSRKMQPDSYCVRDQK